MSDTPQSLLGRGLLVFRLRGFSLYRSPTCGLLTFGLVSFGLASLRLTTLGCTALHVSLRKRAAFAKRRWDSASAVRLGPDVMIYLKSRDR